MENTSTTLATSHPAPSKTLCTKPAFIRCNYTSFYRDNHHHKKRKKN